MSIRPQVNFSFAGKLKYGLAYLALNMRKVYSKLL